MFILLKLHSQHRSVLFVTSQNRWNSIVELVEQKKDQLDSMLRLQNYLLECAEIKSQIQDKRKAIDATQYMGSDLGGVLALQRRLSTMEGALSVLEPKLLHLQVENYEKYIQNYSNINVRLRFYTQVVFCNIKGYNPHNAVSRLLT